jgi:transcriptional regulator
MLVLRVLSAGPLHGYAIAQRLRQISHDIVKVPQGTLYPALHRLENRKLLASEWKPSETGRTAKYYRLTQKGRGQLKAESESWERLAGAVRAILHGPEGEQA